MWSIGIGFPPDDLSTPFTGHLAALVDNKFLVDASLDQASRPQYDLHMPPVLVSEVPRDFRRGKKGTRHFIENAKGDVVIYEHQLENKFYLISKDWTEESRRRIALSFGTGITQICCQSSCTQTPYCLTVIPCAPGWVM